MPTFQFEKLVRDNITGWHEANGHEVVGSQLTGDELQSALAKKLIEEAHEVVAVTSKDELVEELADVRQVVDDMAAVSNISIEEIATKQQAKFDRKGGFQAGQYVTTITMPEDDRWTVYCRAAPEKYPEVDSSSIAFITGNPEKALNFSKHIGLQVAHQKVDLDEIQTTDHKELVEHKVKQAYGVIGRPVLVEDVFFTFEALGSLPGPFVKFFVNESQGVEKMCRMLDGFDNRRAVASCIFGYYDGHQVQYFESQLGGVVADVSRGEGGYGFDRIFIPDGFDGRTAAELSEEEYERYYTAVKPFAKVRQFLKNDLQ